MTLSDQPLVATLLHEFMGSFVIIVVIVSTSYPTGDPFALVGSYKLEQPLWIHSPLWGAIDSSNGSGFQYQQLLQTYRMTAHLAGLLLGEGNKRLSLNLS